MLDYGLFAYASKDEVLEKSLAYWNPGKTQFWIDFGVPPVIDRREGYVLYDVSGKRLIDVHLNGGTYNLGHRDPGVVAALKEAMDRFDIGNHHFPSLARTALAEALISAGPECLCKVIYASGGGEAIDIALKTARYATGKWKIVSIIEAYHGTPASPWAPGTSGSPGCSWPTGGGVRHVPFNDLEAMEAALHVPSRSPGSGSHSTADVAGELGAGYTLGSCELAERYLSGSL